MGVGLIQAFFCEVKRTKECAWMNVFLILNGNGDFRGIGLVEILWETVTKILDHHFMAAIQFHNTLRGFCTGRGTGTAYLEANLLQELLDLR